MRFHALSLVLMLTAFVGSASAGDIEGQFVLDGDSPLAGAPPRVAKGSMTVRDWEICSKAEVPEELLLVNEKSKGIANIVIYLKKAPPNMPPALKDPKVKAVTFDQRGCRFEPRILPVQIGQTINCTTKDAVAHNVRTAGFANENQNFVVPGNAVAPSPVKLTDPEILPMPVRCDYHPWMDAFWVVTDHPYVAVTDAEGKFSITGLPEGEHKFTVWAELGGYVPVPGGGRTWSVNVTPGKQKLPPVPVPATHFKDGLAKMIKK